MMVIVVSARAADHRSLLGELRRITQLYPLTIHVDTRYSSNLTIYRLESSISSTTRVWAQVLSSIRSIVSVWTTGWELPIVGRFQKILSWGLTQIFLARASGPIVHSVPNYDSGSTCTAHRKLQKLRSSPHMTSYPQLSYLPYMISCCNYCLWYDSIAGQCVVVISQYTSKEADNAGCSGGGVQYIPRAPVAGIWGGEWVVGEMAFVHLTHHAADAMNARRKWPPA